LSMVSSLIERPSSLRWRATGLSLAPSQAGQGLAVAASVASQFDSSPVCSAENPSALVPVPWQTRHQPWGELNDSCLGSGSGKLRAQFGQARRLEWIVTRPA